MATLFEHDFTSGQVGPFTYRPGNNGAIVFNNGVVIQKGSSLIAQGVIDVVNDFGVEMVIRPDYASDESVAGNRTMMEVTADDNKPLLNINWQNSGGRLRYTGYTPNLRQITTDVVSFAAGDRLTVVMERDATNGLTVKLNGIEILNINSEATYTDDISPSIEDIILFVGQNGSYGGSGVCESIRVYDFTDEPAESENDLFSADFSGGTTDGLTYTDGATNTPSFDGANGIVMPVGAKLASGDDFILPAKNFAIDFTYLPIDNSGDARADYHMLFRLSNAADTMSIAFGVHKNFNRFLLYRDYTVAGNPSLATLVNETWSANTPTVLRIERTDEVGLVVKQDDVLIHSLPTEAGEFEESLTRLEINPQITVSGNTFNGLMAAVTSVAVSTVPQPEEVDIVNHDFTGGTLGPFTLVGAGSPTYDANGLVLSDSEHLEADALFSLINNYGAEIVFRIPVASTDSAINRPLFEMYNAESPQQEAEAFLRSIDRVVANYRVVSLVSTHSATSAHVWAAGERLTVNSRRTDSRGVLLKFNGAEVYSLTSKNADHDTALDKIQINKSNGWYYAMNSEAITIESIRIYDWKIAPEGGIGGGGTTLPEGAGILRRRASRNHQRLVRQILQPGRR